MGSTPSMQYFGNMIDVIGGDTITFDIGNGVSISNEYAKFIPYK